MTTIGDATEVTYTAPDSTVGRTVYDKLAEGISVKDFGAVGDGSDATTAIENAIAAASQNSPDRYNRVVHFPCGIYLVIRPIVVPQGILLRGEGSQGSNEAKGTVLLYNDNTENGRNFITFDGNGGPAAATYGTGGGLENFTIMVATGKQAGVAVTIKAIDCVKRAGEMMVTNVLITPQSPSTETVTTQWTQGLVVDGTGCNNTTSGGLRTLSIRKLRVTDCSLADKSIEFKSARHIFASGVEVDNGSTPNDHGITFSGINDGVFIESSEVYGNVIIPAKNLSSSPQQHTRNFHFTGKVTGKFECQDDEVEGTVRLSGSEFSDTPPTPPATHIPPVPPTVIRKSPNLKIIAGYTGNVLYTLATESTSAVTGDGTTVDVIFDKKRADSYSLYNTSNGKFTCVVPGMYDISYHYMLKGVTTSNTRYDAAIQHIVPGAGGSTSSYWQLGNPSNQTVTSAGHFGVSQRVVCWLNAGDQVKVTMNVSGSSTKNVKIYGYSSDVTLYGWLCINYVV